jgi:hypothetical protein
MTDAGRAGRERALRDARPDHAPYDDLRRPRLHDVRTPSGFVRHLPHQLVEAFRSTLEEVADADLLLHVVDGAHPDPRGRSRRSARCSPTSTPARCPRSS